MTENTGRPDKMCPRCNKGYPEEDNYCGTDGSLLEIIDSNDVHKAVNEESE